jgi:hypothetical protein
MKRCEKFLKKDLVHDAKRDIGQASVRRKRSVEDTEHALNDDDEGLH